MKRLTLLAGLLALSAPAAFAQTSTWVSDLNHSEVNFTITHMGLTKVHGRFGAVKATVMLNEADISKSTVNATIGVDTINTGVDARNNDLKGANFFDVVTMPIATFASTSVTKNGNKLTVTGNLTLHGVTKPVVLAVEGPTAPMTGNGNKVHEGYSATTTIDRTDFGVGPKFTAAMLGDDVNLDIELDVVKQ